MASRNQVLVASASRTTSGNSADLSVANESAAAFYLSVTAATGTSPTLDVVVEVKDAAGVYYPIATFAQLAAAGTERIAITPLPDSMIRVTWTIGGTTPDFTFSVGASFKDYG